MVSNTIRAANNYNMRKITVENVMADDPMKVLQQWRIVNDKITIFINVANPRVYMFIFGESEGMRLWEHFVNNCDRHDFQKFMTYLTSEQYNDLMINLYYNDGMYSLVHYND